MSTLRTAAMVAIAMALVACPDKNEGADAGANASASANANASDGAAPAAVTAADGKKLVREACLSCHSEHMLAQQRLTPAQWQKTVGKMVIWGANLDPKEIDPVVAYLVSTSGPNAGPYVPETVPAGDALTEIAALPDDPFPPGDIERGKALFVNKCSGCHGSDARGALGVALVDKPFLYRAVEFSRTVRRGRGKMIPIPLSDAEIGDVLAYLRSLRSPPLP
ncbi:MAG: putative Sulfite:cytochrome c oxidoreductase, subunit [Myxococcaceae bacterium]|nr:putative Sulfite:cytochrome c oxidoreductase, subunit [Myxococcaceae bacterium]